MYELNLTEQEAVSGGNPLLVYVVNLVVGGIVYDGLKAAYEELSNTEYGETTGGNMQRGKQLVTKIVAIMAITLPVAMT